MPLRTTLLASAVALATVVPVWAATPSEARVTSDAIAAAVPDDDPKPIVPIRDGEAYTVKKEGLSIAIPYNPATMVELRAQGEQTVKAAAEETAAGVEVGSPGDAVGIGLPRTHNPSITSVQNDGTVTYVDKIGPYNVAVQALDDGSARVMVVVKKPNAPRSYVFPVKLPIGGSLAMDGDGGVLVKGSDGVAIGAIAAPWATDANGVTIPTRYRISGSTIVQEVDHAGAAYPVVSDPKISLCFHWGVRVCVKFTKAETKKIAAILASSGVKEGVAAFCGFLPNKPPVMIPIKVACAVAAAKIYASIKNTFVTAKNKGKCVRIRFLTNGLPVTWNVVNC